MTTKVKEKRVDVPVGAPEVSQDEHLVPRKSRFSDLQVKNVSTRFKLGNIWMKREFYMLIYI